MKKLTIALLFIVAISVSATEILPKCAPWKSKGLNQVKITFGQENLTLAENGQATVSIVVPADKKSYYYMNTAKLLKEQLEAATGTKFNIVRGKLSSGKGIFIGPCDNATVTQAFNDAQKMPEESFMVISFAQGIMLLGNDQPNKTGRAPGKLNITTPYWSKGTLFASIDFLQRMLGFRFYFPGELGTIVPDYKSSPLTIPNVSYTDKPVFQFRLTSYHNHGFTDNASAKTKDNKTRHKWSTMMRLGGLGNQRTGHTDGKWHKLFAKSHPEYFAKRADGSRMIGVQAGHSVQRCYTNEDGFQAHLNEIDKFYKGGKDYTAFATQNMTPDQKYIRWWPNDGFSGCYCEACTKLTDPKAPLNRRHSRLIWDYVSRLAKECNKRWPGKKLLVPAYSSFRVVPDYIKVPNNVEIIPVLPGSGFSMAYLKEPICRQIADKDVKRLKKLNSGKVWMWMHYPHRPRITNQIHIPYPVPHYMKDFIKDNQDVFSGFYLNGHPTTVLALDSIVLYLWFQLLWNPDLDVDAVSDEYCNLMFGQAATTMKQYFKLITDRWENTRWKNLPDFENAQDRISSIIPQSCYFEETYPAAVRDKLKLMLNKALKETAKGTIYRERMDWMLDGTKKFFVQGQFVDIGKAVKATAATFTPKIDGDISDWKNIQKIELVDNASGETTDRKTEISMAFDKNNLYFSGDVKSKNGKFNTSGKKLPRDMSLWNKDNIEIFICGDLPGLIEAGFPQNSQFHHIIFNVDGSIYDAYKDSDGKSDKKVNLNFDLITKRTKDGFVFELKIPFKSLNAIPPKPGSTWPVNIYRTHGPETKKIYSAWSPTMGSFHDSTRFGMLEFPRNTLWQMPLKSLKGGASPFMSPKTPAGVKADISFKNDQMIVKCQASPDLKKKFELKFYGKTSVRPDINNSKKPLVFRMEVDMKGKGIFRVRGGTGPIKKRDEYIGKMYWPRVSKDQAINEIVVLQADRAGRGKGKQVYSSQTCVFAIQANPGAEFTVTLKKMEIFVKN